MPPLLANYREPLMATQYTDQTNVNLNTNPPGALKTQDVGGRVRCLVFSIQTSASIGAQNDVFVIGDLPAGARVLYGWCDFGAMGVSATLSIGPSGAATKYASAVSVASAGQALFANTLALNMGNPTSTSQGSGVAGTNAAVERVLGTFGGATWAATKTLIGVLLYVKD